MTKDERIRELKKDFKKLFEKFERIIKSADRKNEPERFIDIIQLTYYIFHRINDNIKIMGKL